MDLSNVEQIVMQLCIHSTFITAPAEILEKKCRPNHEGCKKHVKRKLYHEDIH